MIWQTLMRLAKTKRFAVFLLKRHKSKTSQSQSRSKSVPWLRSQKAKQVFSFCRWLHIYISCALFSLLLFFCFSGITLNHASWTQYWWAGQSSNSITTLELPTQLTNKKDDDYQLSAIQNFIEQNSQLENPRTIDLALDFGEITYDYPLPAGYAFVTVLIEDRLIEIEYANGNLLALLNDLHKGRHSGGAWSWLIDGSAVLMMLFSLTGLVIVFQNAKHRKQASLLLILGTMSPVLLYLSWVPK